MKINKILLFLLLCIAQQAHGMMVQKIDWIYPENFNVTVRIHTHSGISVQYFPMKKSQTVGDLQKNIADWLRVPFNSLRVMATRRSLEGTVAKAEYPSADATLVETTEVLNPWRPIINDEAFGIPIYNNMLVNVDGIMTKMQYTLGYYPPSYDVVSLLEADTTEKMIEQFKEVITYGISIKREQIQTFWIDSFNRADERTFHNDFSDFK